MKSALVHPDISCAAQSTDFAASPCLHPVTPSHRHSVLPSPSPLHLRPSRRGNAVLEAALVLPILLSLAFGTIEFGHFYFIKHNLQGAARQGARAAIPAGATNNDVAQAVGNALSAAGLQGSQYTIATTPADITAAAPGDDITVAIQCTWGTIGVRPLALISADKPVKAATVMRKE